MDFPKQLAMWRESLGLTLQQVGSAAGRSKQCALQWERGLRTPSMEDVKNVAALFAATLPRVFVAPPARKVGRPRTRPIKASAGARA